MYLLHAKRCPCVTFVSPHSNPGRWVLISSAFYTCEHGNLTWLRDWLTKVIKPVGVRVEILTWVSATPDPMPSTPLSSGWQASGHKWNPLQAWYGSLKSVHLCRANPICWRTEVTIYRPSIDESCWGIQALTDVLTRGRGVSVAASLPWVQNKCFHVPTFWSTFERLILPQMN